MGDESGVSPGLSRKRWAEIEHLLDLALDRPVEERRAFVERYCAEDATLRDVVERLLDSCERPQAWLDGQAPTYSAPLVSEVDEPGTAEGARIGPYRIVGEAGHGGMGTVYLAERDEPYHQRVALKLVRGGVARDDHLVRRFVEERQILASLEHPRIARLLDGGITSEGLPWFALEYVEGLPIDRYADLHGLSVEARLELFLAVCDAVQYAHRNLVVHRDIKPSNILVTADGQVKLLDFGIAKLVAGGQPAETGTGLRLMTLEYASPEQFRGQPVTVASDVYSLGVLLYQLLTTRLPYRLAGRSALDIERALLEQEPERPSSAVSDSRLARRLRGDLDTIVLTALRKEPARRYSSVEQLATDLRRYLAGRPVAARPDRWGYRAGKFVRRHRVGVVAAGAILLSLVGGLAATAWQAREATQAAGRAERVTELLVSLFREADPEQARGREVTARELLQRGERRLDSMLLEEPETRARLLGALGVIHGELGLYASADSLLARAAALTAESQGDQSPELAARLAERSNVLSEQAKYAEADSAIRRALAIQRRRFGPEDSTVAASLRALGGIARRRGQYDSAEAFYRQALAIDLRVYGEGHLVVADDLHDLSVLLENSGKLVAADSALSAALAIRRRRLDPEHPAITLALSNLGVIRYRQGNHEESERLKREVLDRRRRLYPEGHPLVAAAMRELGTHLNDRGRYEEAESLFIQAHTMQRSLLGPDHPEVFMTLNNLAVLRYWKGHFKAAERDMRAVYEHHRTTLGEHHTITLTALTNLGAIARDQGNYREADQLLRRALATSRRLFGDAHRDVAQAWSNLAGLLFLKGDMAGAERAYREGLAIDRKVLPAGHHLIAWRLHGLGQVLSASGRAAEAEPLLREALAVRTKQLDPGDRLTAKTRLRLGECLIRLGRFQEGEALLLQSHRELSAVDNWFARRDVTESARQLAAFYSSRGRAREAARYQTLAEAPPR